jgi:hypothetical protein
MFECVVRAAKAQGTGTGEKQPIPMSALRIRLQPKAGGKSREFVYTLPPEKVVETTRLLKRRYRLVSQVEEVAPDVTRLRLAPGLQPREASKPGSLPWPREFSLGARAQAAGRTAEEITALKDEMKVRMRSPIGATGAFALAVASRTVENVVGFGFGAKVTNGQVAAVESVRVYVRRKLPRSRLGASEVVPAKINGLPSDVIELPNLTAQSVNCGVSVGHYLCTAGTIGCLVAKGGSTYILSNNHVLANCNNAQQGDNILQPGPADNGEPPPIATLSDFQALDFSGSDNALDAAIAALVDAGSVLPQVDMIGALSPNLVTAQVGLAVKKTGRTSGLTSGFVEAANEDVTVDYGPAGKAYFQNQVAIRGANGLFSQPGDSGSLVVSANGNGPVALLFAGDPDKGLSFATGIAGVLGRFGVTLVT